MANRTKLTPELIGRLCEPIRHKGLSEADVARLFRIPTSTWYQWTSIGRRDLNAGTESVYAELAEALAHADAEFHASLLDRIQHKADVEHAGGHYLTWLAEKKYPRQYGNVIRVEVNREVERILDAVERVADPETYGRILEAITSTTDSDQATGEAGESPAIH